MFSPLRSSEFSHGPQTTARGTIRVSETFCSRQGEGKLTGTESFFIRTSGCNLRCWFCDTPYASWNPQGEFVEFEQLLAKIAESGVGHVVLTGGEPMLSKESTLLCQAIQSEGYHLTVETAGTIDRETPCDLLSISPKFHSSTPNADVHGKWSRLHAERRLPVSTMRRLIDAATDYQLKFVVDSPDDYDELHSIVDQLRVPHAQVWVMPQGSTNEAMDHAHTWLLPWVQAEGFRYCDRMQIRWFGNRRGT